MWYILLVSSRGAGGIYFLSVAGGVCCSRRPVLADTLYTATIAPSVSLTNGFILVSLRYLLPKAVPSDPEFSVHYDVISV